MLRACLLLCSGVLCAAVAAAAEPPDAFAGLEYRSVGPAVGGRITRVSGVAGDPLTWYLAAAQGGVWRSVDGGIEWEPIFDKMPSNSVGALAVAPSDANVIYVGGGEANIRGNVQPGEGLFVSTDGGRTWKHTLKLRAAVGHIVVHPRDADTAWAAVLGSPFADGSGRGVYRTQDAGASWEQVLKVDARTGASDVAVDAGNPRILWAGTWQARRQPWGLTSGGPGSGLWRSADGGDSWTRLPAGEKGLPKGDWGKVGVAVSPADGDRIYALIEAVDGGLFRSDDGGESFERVNDHWVLRQRAWYYTTLVPDPWDADTVWFPQVPLLRTRDGGKSLHQVDGTSHGDHHDLWIDPEDPQRMIVGHDGGVDLTVDGGWNWRAPDLQLGQFYNIDVDRRLPYHIGGTLQDMGTVSGPVLSLLGDGSTVGDWLNVGGGEAGDFRYDLELPGVVYAGEYGGYLSRHDESHGQARAIMPVTTDPLALPAAEMKVRFQWTAPIELSPHDPATLYHGANVLYRSRDRGETWAAISPDLTRNDKSKQGWSGGPITGDNTGVEVYGTIFAIDESPLTRGEIWTGSDDGRVHLSRDNGASWNDVTPSALAVDSTVEALVASRHAPGRAYLVAHRYRLGDDRPLVFATDDHGASWRSLAGSLPDDMPLFSLAEDERSSETLYLGGERDLYASNDRGRRWQSIRMNLPPVAAVDLEAAHGDLIVGTRGRGLHVFHVLSALRRALAGRPGAPTLLATDAVRWRNGERWGQDGGTDNPGYGARLRYFLPAAVDGELRLRIVDAEGAEVRVLSSVAKPPRGTPDDPEDPRKPPKPELKTTPGWHEVHWDLRHPGSTHLRDAKQIWGDAGDGPLALPGRYRAELVAGTTAANAEFELAVDPRSPADAAALAANHAFGRQLLQSLETTRLGIEWVRAALAQAQDLQERLAGAHPDVVAAAAAVAARAQAIEGQLHNPEAKVAYDFLRGPKGVQLYSQTIALYEWSQSSDHAPTAAMQVRANELAAMLAERRAAIAAMESAEVATLETAVTAAKLPRLILPALDIR